MYKYIKIPFVYGFLILQYIECWCHIVRKLPWYTWELAGIGEQRRQFHGYNHRLSLIVDWCFLMDQPIRWCGTKEMYGLDKNERKDVSTKVVHLSFGISIAIKRCFFFNCSPQETAAVNLIWGPFSKYTKLSPFVHA